MKKEQRIQINIKDWYAKNGRDLPWRSTREPYLIWLSEIIMQQTRIDQGTPYYLRFVEHYPTVFELANAPEQEVLRMWQGLGYYSRARNMHHTAKMITEQYQGVFPSDYSALIKLKGIGDYTACEILSYCFNKPFAILDGNVFRLLSRLFEIREYIDSSSGKYIFKKQANHLLDHKNPGNFNQALMDIGATICTPKNPDCGHCPLQSDCVAFEKNSQHELPLKSATKELRNRYLYYFLIQKDNGIYIRKREGKDIWQNLYDLPGIEKNTKAEITSIEIADYLGQEPENMKLIHQLKHPLSHQQLHISFYQIKSSISKPPFQVIWIPLTNLDNFPFPKPVLQFLEVSFRPETTE